MLGTVPEGAVWAIPLLPLGSLVAITLLRPEPRWSGYLTVGSIALSFLFSLWVLDSAIAADGERIAFESHEWLTLRSLGVDLTINVGARVDGLTAVMLLVVTGVSLAVQFYSQAYMAGDGGYSRYFAYMSLFTASMLILILADNLILLYVAWELVGLCSYLLIGFWFHRPAAARAAMKAFVVTRLGDLGFLLAILLMYAKANTFDIGEIQELAVAGALSSGIITVFALGILSGAMGKSAQFPLHVWLPDAMEGPTPVSALIHAATMVAAGVYLVARFFPVFDASEGAMHTIAAIGAVTALLAATMGVVMTDIKRVLAYSTISQLGYMMLALGVGGYVAAIFHLFTHAFFKSLLFLGAGSVNHATFTFDMRRMGGLRRVMPWTYLTFLIASLSLAGVFPFAGFWSKDEILVDAWLHQKAVFAVALTVVFLTAFYMFRTIFLTFEGEYQGGEEPEEGHTAPAEHVGPHESPWVMVGPLVVLAVPALLVGLANINDGVGHLLRGALPEAMRESAEKAPVNWAILFGSLGLAFAGIGLAWLIYGVKVLSAERLRRAFGPAHTLVEQKYYFDHLYERGLMEGVVYRGMGFTLALFDSRVVDDFFNRVAWLMGRFWAGLRWVQSGQLQAYGAVAFAGLLLAVAIILALNPP